MISGVLPVPFGLLNLPSLDNQKRGEDSPIWTYIVPYSPIEDYMGKHHQIHRTVEDYIAIRNCDIASRKKK